VEEFSLKEFLPAHFRLKYFEQALEAWEKSLEINPNQPQVKKNVEALKEKK